MIVGKRGWLYDDFFARLEASPAKQAVIFPGFVPDADLPAVYAAAQALAFPSEFEGFGLPVLEAMACGTPVVCSNTSSLPEVTSPIPSPTTGAPRPQGGARDRTLLVDPLDVDALHALGGATLAADLRARAGRPVLLGARRGGNVAVYRRLTG